MSSAHWSIETHYRWEDSKRYTSNVADKPECKKCAKALQELENIDDEADQLGIGFVKIHDEELAEEYSLGEMPRLVYYRHEIPIIYEGTRVILYSFWRLNYEMGNERFAGSIT